MRKAWIAGLLTVALALGVGIGQVWDMPRVSAQGEVTMETHPLEVTLANETHGDAEFLRKVREWMEDRLAAVAPARATFEANPGVIVNDGRADNGVRQLTAQQWLDIWDQMQGVYDVLKSPADIVTTRNGCIRNIEVE